MATFWSTCGLCGKRSSARGNIRDGDPLRDSMLYHVAKEHGWENLSEDEQQDVIDYLWRRDHRIAQMKFALYASAGDFLKSWDLNKHLVDVVADANKLDVLYQMFGEDE